MTSFALAIIAALLISLSPHSAGAVGSSTIEYTCPNYGGGEHCTISVRPEGGICSPTGLGGQANNNRSGGAFSPTLVGSGAAADMPYGCIGIFATDLVEGGGDCVVSCPGSCQEAPGGKTPCAGYVDPNTSNGSSEKCQFNGADVACDDAAFTSGAPKLLFGPEAHLAMWMAAFVFGHLL
jgi:hypothetical protein